jgi:mannose-1-phosphate guanylyltransferase
MQALKEAGCDEVVLAINYRPQVMMDFLKEWEEKLGIKITCSQEPEPMGTAGPLALAREILDDGSGTPFFVLNSDVICEYPLSDMLAFHKSTGAEATILVTKVTDPSKYGVVVMDDAGKVDRFVEKPKEFVGDKINAGIYCCNPSVLDRIEPRPTSIEKEVFPAIAANKSLFAMELEGYWMDVGQPKDYLTGLQLHLEALRKRKPHELKTADYVRGNIIVDETAQVGSDCVIGPNVSIGKGCVIGNGVRLSNCVILHRVKVKDYARVADSIVGWGCSVGRWARIDNKAVIGEDVFVGDEIYLNGAVVLPHKDIKESVLEPGTIIM